MSSGLDACSRHDGQAQAGSGSQRRAHWQAGNFTASGALEKLSVFAQILHWN